MSESTHNPKATRLRRRLIVAYVLFVVASVGASACVGRGSFLHFIWAVGVTYVGIAVLFLGLLLHFTGAIPSKRWRHRLRTAAACLIFVSIPMLVQPLSIPLGRPLLGGQIEASQRYCESLVPALEEYKAKNGSYPNNIARLQTDAGPRPWLLRGNRNFYGCDPTGQHFWFHVDDPKGMMDFWAFDSKSRKWRKED